MRRYLLNPLYLAWIILNLLNFAYIIYSLLFKITIYIFPDNMDTQDQRSLLRLLLIQFLIWGNAVIWCQPLSIAFFLIPLLYFWFQHTAYAKDYISRIEINLILWIIASYFINIVFFLSTSQEPKNFAYFKFLFFLGTYNPLG